MSILKKELRKKMKTLFQSIDSQNIELQSRIVTEKILNSSHFQESKRISIFVSTTDEISTDVLIRNSLQQGKLVFVPQFSKGNPVMRMVCLPNIDDFESLSTTLWNIKQPSLEKNWEDYFLSGPIDLAVVPGVAFTKDGQRLGHGMGYYDRWFLEHEKYFGRRPYSIGLALNQQIVDTVPTTETDVTLDEVISS